MSNEAKNPQNGQLAQSSIDCYQLGPNTDYTKSSFG